MEFKPDRYLGENPAAGEKFAYVPFGAGRRKKIIISPRSLCFLVLDDDSIETIENIVIKNWY